MDSFLNGLSSLRNYYIYASLFVSVPSFLLYLSEIIVIIRHKQFHNSFYKLFIVRSIPDFFNFLSSVYGYRLPIILGNFLLPLYQSIPDLALNLYRFFLYFCFYADNLATAFIQINRFIAIAFPFNYEEIWRKLLPISILITYGLSLFLSFQFFLMSPILAINPSDPLNGNGTSFSFAESGTHYVRDSNNLVAIFSAIFLAGCTLLNFCTFFLYKSKRLSLAQNRQKEQNNTSAANSTNTSSTNTVSDNIERNLLIYAMCIFVGRALITLMMVGFSISWVPLSAFLKSIGTLASDIGTLILESCLLLWASDNFREKWADDFLPAKLNPWKEKLPSNKTVVNVVPSANRHNQINMLPLSTHFPTNRVSVA